MDYFAFLGQANDVVELTLTGDVCCVYYLAAVFEPDGSLLASFGSNALQELTLPVTGQYAVRVTSYDYAFTGSYGIGFSCRSPLGPVVADLTCDVPVSSPSGSPVHTFHSKPPEYSTKRFKVPGVLRVNSADSRVGPNRPTESSVTMPRAAHARSARCNATG